MPKYYTSLTHAKTIALHLQSYMRSTNDLLVFLLTVWTPALVFALVCSMGPLPLYMGVPRGLLVVPEVSLRHARLVPATQQRWLHRSDGIRPRRFLHSVLCVLSRS